MSGWNWALMALSGQGGCEMSSAGLEIAAATLESTRNKTLEEPSTPLPIVFQDDAGPVLKAYYEAQPG